MPDTLLPINTKVTTVELAETMFGDGIKLVSASYAGDPQSSGIYSPSTKVAPGAVPSDSGVILSTGTVTHVTNAKGGSNQSASTSTDTNGWRGRLRPADGRNGRGCAVRGRGR